MNEVCEKCGLPKNICVCREIEKESQKIQIRVARARFKKLVTTVSGIDDKESAKALERVLKRKLACGGTVKGTTIELQGDHRKKVKEVLLQQGYRQELIEN